ncbi:hypothetical protein [Billgrantia sp. C5P2]|uniref:hypothetical protein n=1 Tax=Billgrantia sp. C5P2 TaxID=3436239 RepID=UPI003DA3BE56
MNLKSGYPFWAVKNGLMHAFPQLDAELSRDVAVAGAGTELLCAQIERRQHPLAALFSFARMERH